MPTENDRRSCTALDVTCLFVLAILILFASTSLIMLALTILFV